jgi:hypothetical protein
VTARVGLIARNYASARDVNQGAGCQTAFEEKWLR